MTLLANMFMCSTADCVETFGKRNSEADSYGNAVRNETHSWPYDCPLSHVGMEVVEDGEEKMFKDINGSRDIRVQEKSANVNEHERTFDHVAEASSIEQSSTKKYSGGNYLFPNTSQQPNEQSYQYDISHMKNTTYDHISSPTSGTRIDVTALISKSSVSKDIRIKTASTQ